MFTFDSLSNACKNAKSFCAREDYDKCIIEKVATITSEKKCEWILYLKRVRLDPLIIDEGEGGILLVDASTGDVRAFEML